MGIYIIVGTQHNSTQHLAQPLHRPTPMQSSDHLHRVYSSKCPDLDRSDRLCRCAQLFQYRDHS